MPGLALPSRKPWWTHQSQLWRLRHPHLWPGGSFDRADQASTIKYALLRLPEVERDVFVRNRFGAWDYPLLRTEQWRKRSYAASEEVELAPPSFGEGEPPDEMFERSTARHDQRAVLSPIEMGLWNAAGWTATFFGHFPAKPPIFGLGFKNEPAAAAILDGWIRRWGNRDEKEDLRVAIITGISRRNPTHYVVSIGPNMTRPRDGQKYFSIVMRRCRMTPKTTVNLDTFLKQYAEYGAYFLTTSGMYGSEEIDPSRLLLKAQLDVKAAWQIGPNDPDLGAIEDDDDPYIPPGEPDPPLKRALAWQKAMRARTR